MPRPKRSRTAPAKAAAKTAESVAAITAEHVRNSSTDIYDVSDREKERVKARNVAKGKGKEGQVGSRNARSMRMSSRHADADTTSSLETRRPRNLSRQRSGNDTSITRTHGMLQLPSSESDVRSPPVKFGRNDFEDARARRMTDLSGLDLDDDVFGNLDDSLDLNDDTRSTPGGSRISLQSSRNPTASFFNRGRPRASSIVSRDDAPIRPSSRGPNTPGIGPTLNLRLFRRRAREPSILGTTQKERAPRSQEGLSRDERKLEVDDDDDEEGFGSDAEKNATPLPRPRLSGRSFAEADKKSLEESLVRPSRKRKSLEEDDGGEKRPALGTDLEMEDADDVAHSSPSLPNLTRPRSWSPSAEYIDPNDPDMAPPISSGSSADSEVAWPSLERLAHRIYNHHKRPGSRSRKTPEPVTAHDKISDVSSPPSLTHSPNFRETKKAPPPKRKAAPGSLKVTAADLDAFLPRRRQKPTYRKAQPETEDWTISGLAQGEDELSYLDSRTAAARRRMRAGKAVEKKQSSSGRPIRRIYGKQNGPDAASDADTVDDTDKERDEQEQSEFVERLPKVRGGLDFEELKRAAKKFKEVDKWELEFEEVLDSSSSRDAR